MGELCPFSGDGAPQQEIGVAVCQLAVVGRQGAAGAELPGHQRRRDGGQPRQVAARVGVLRPRRRHHLQQRRRPPRIASAGDRQATDLDLADIEATLLLGLALIDSRALHGQAPRHAAAGARPTTWQSLREGVIYVWKTPTVLLAILVSGLVLLFGSNFNVFLPLFATDVLNIGATGFGMLFAAIGVGSLLSSLWLAWSNEKPTMGHLLVGTLVFGLLEATFALSHVFLLSLVLITSVGFMEVVFAVQAITMIQTVVPNHLRGRVMSIAILLFDGSVPPGYLLAGWLSGCYGASVAMLICVLLSVLSTGVGWIWWKSVEKDGTE